MHYIKRLLLTGLFSSLFVMAGAQQINWVSIENAPQNSGKLFLVDFYTNWCGYCKKMDRETFTNPTVVKIINKYYVPVKFNAEGNTTFVWHGVKYTPTPTPPGSRPSVHMFTKSVLGQKIGFPSFGFFNSDQTLMTIVQGYQNADEFAVMLWYFASGDNKRYAFDHYRSIFDKDIRPAMNRALNME
ncbi:MAG: hypothetical protein, DUF255 [bacterium P3]|nr:MAG: hypothetical protein, DUF255 [bacterium P201]KWW30467.1 MAG: hypothetical protein, DUF255 [bacterium P3]KWW41354.1 MAG: hypothetical protein, DUF255 [bacterium F083]